MHVAFCANSLSVSKSTVYINTDLHFVLHWHLRTATLLCAGNWSWCGGVSCPGHCSNLHLLRLGAIKHTVRRLSVRCLAALWCVSNCTVHRSLSFSWWRYTDKPITFSRGDTQLDTLTNGWIDRYTSRHMDRQTDKLTGRLSWHRRVNRQINIHTDNR